MNMPKPTFSMGKVCCTPAAMSVLGELGISRLLRRHCTGDWGDVAQDSVIMNDKAVRDGNGDILSVYNVNGYKVWIQTYIGLSTTIMLAEEY